MNFIEEWVNNIINSEQVLIDNSFYLIYLLNRYINNNNRAIYLFCNSLGRIINYHVYKISDFSEVFIIAQN